MLVAIPVDLVTHQMAGHLTTIMISSYLPAIF